MDYDQDFFLFHVNMLFRKLTISILGFFFIFFRNLYIYLLSLLLKSVKKNNCITNKL